MIATHDTRAAAAAPRFVGEDDVARWLDPQTARSVAAESFALLAEGKADNPVRERRAVGGAVANTMWAAVPELGLLGTKVYPVIGDGATVGRGHTVMVYDLSTGDLRAVVAAEGLGLRRTAAVSAVAVEALGRPGGDVLALIGAGALARHHAVALADAWPTLSTILIAGRSRARRDALVDELRAVLPALDARAAQAEAAVRAADVVVTVTSAHEPVLHGAWLRPGTLVVAAGANDARRRELDREAVLRADRVLVDHGPVAEVECGDLLANGLAVERVEELGTALAAPRRVGPDDVVLVETHGLALLDLMCAAHVAHAMEGEGA